MIYCGTSMIFNIIIIVTFIIIVIIIHWYAPWIVSYGRLLLYNDDYNDYYGSYCPYFVLLLITCCFYYDDNYDDHADFSRMRSEGFPFIVWGFGGWTLVRLQLLVASSWRRRRVVVAPLIPCLWGKLQNLFLFAGHQAGPHVVLRGRHGTLWHSNLFENVSKVSKLEDVSHETLVLLRLRRRVYGGSYETSVSASPLASPCLWGKLQNLSLVSSFCLSSGVAVPAL